MYRSGGHPMLVLRSNGTQVTNSRTAAEIFLATCPAPGPDHPTWYVKDRSGVSMFDLYDYQPPWAGATLEEFFWGLIHKRYIDWSTRDFTLSRYNAVARIRDQKRVYIIDNPNLLCVESRFTNTNLSSEQ